MRERAIGLTGGIGSGKSTVAGLLRDRGAYVVDADKIAREVVEPGTPGLAALAAEFGDGVVNPDGSLDRAGMARLVFADPAALERLNGIMFPLIFVRTEDLFAAAPEGTVIVHDVALLAELGMGAAYALVVVVDAPDEVRVERLVGRGLEADDARRRIAAQLSRADRLAVADVVIDNSDGLDRLREQVDVLWERLQRL